MNLRTCSLVVRQTCHHSKQMENTIYELTNCVHRCLITVASLDKSLSKEIFARYRSMQYGVNISNFRGELRKTHDRRRGVRIDPWRSSEVDDFRVIWKGLCDFLLVINSNLSSISHRFWDTTTYRLKIANYPYPTSVQPQIWKCSFCTRSLKFCVGRAKTLG